MPTYEYQCRTCGSHFEKIQRYSDSPLTECPKCGAEVRRVIHPSGVIFKGAGWYITDSRKANTDRKAGEDKAAAASSGGEGSKAGASSDGEGSKPAASSSSDGEGSKSTPAEKTAAGSED